MQKILVWNVASLPKYVNITGYGSTSIKEKADVIKLLARNKNANQVFLQEAFDVKLWKMTGIHVNARKHSPLTLTCGLAYWSEKFSPLWQRFIPYTNSAFEDKLATKGMHITKWTYQKDAYCYVINTHMQADSIADICRLLYGWYWMSNKFCGKRRYKSPEVAKKRGQFNARCNDVFCLGVFPVIVGKSVCLSTFVA